MESCLLKYVEGMLITSSSLTGLRFYKKEKLSNRPEYRKDLEVRHERDPAAK